MEKKIEVEINGRVRRIPAHMLEDMLRFGATETKRAIKQVPKELLKFPDAKKIIVPEPKEIIKDVSQFPEPKKIILKEAPAELIKDPLPEAEPIKPATGVVEVFEQPGKAKRKTPVKAKK